MNRSDPRPRGDVKFTRDMCCWGIFLWWRTCRKWLNIFLHCTGKYGCWTKQVLSLFIINNWMINYSHKAINHTCNWSCQLNYKCNWSNQIDERLVFVLSIMDGPFSSVYPQSIQVWLHIVTLFFGCYFLKVLQVAFMEVLLETDFHNELGVPWECAAS